MTARAVRDATDRAPGPRGGAAALTVAGFARHPLDGYLRLYARYGDVVRVPVTPRDSFFILSRPEHAEHVLAANQDNYVKAVTYRPLRALIGNSLLTSEGADWRRHRRLVQPVFSRRDVQAFGPAVAQAVQRMLARWDALADGSTVNVAEQVSGLALDIAGRALFGADLTNDARQLSRVMDAGQLPWTRAVVAEAMRLYPPAWTIERNALAGDDVAGVPVPGGSLVAIPPYLVHRHPEFWPDGAGFDPARFLPGTHPPHRYAYIPFGGGRRACVGQSFAELETVLVLAAIAQQFRLELTPRGLPRPVANITLRPGRALPMRLVRR